MPPSPGAPWWQGPGGCRAGRPSSALRPGATARGTQVGHLPGWTVRLQVDGGLRDPLTGCPKIGLRETQPPLSHLVLVQHQESRVHECGRVEGGAPPTHGPPAPRGPWVRAPSRRPLFLPWAARWLPELRPEGLSPGRQGEQSRPPGPLLDGTWGLCARLRMGQRESGFWGSRPGPEPMLRRWLPAVL